ncbi:carbohydrate kinase family protein [Lachnoclostridium sp. An138]|uniref:carbohydrate kinase family protein n=1 Tax=Lachnoclostridium sp. An138 TaxID=1965560 RepID=UPI000B375DE8|nr:carbohydrate kinase family protein [Lachnoclostridium sp. An138]OUQ15593.1 carbohydrate kinase family protein [Lachnoclostridium sp. An138]
MRKGICVAGNLVVDITYPIERWPRQSELTTITEGITRSVGGAVCNVVTDLARMDKSLPLSALGVIGQDAEGDFILEQLGKYRNVDLSLLGRKGATSFTAVMSDNRTKARTFFQYRGANALFDESFIDWEKIDAELLHVGYILLLDALDQEDAEYGTKMARLLAEARRRGLKTSIDVVTETGDRFRTLVPPALRYTDYCVINELEAQQITGVPLRDESEKLYPENMKEALERMKELGVSTWAVIHCPEGGYGLDEENRYVSLSSLRLPEGYIKGTVGAGDAFCAGVLYGAQKRWALPESIRLGTCAAAASLSEPGASEGVGTAEEVLKLWDRFG